MRVYTCMCVYTRVCVRACVCTCLCVFGDTETGLFVFIAQLYVCVHGKMPMGRNFRLYEKQSV